MRPKCCRCGQRARPDDAAEVGEEDAAGARIEQTQPTTSWSCTPRERSAALARRRRRSATRRARPALGWSTFDAAVSPEGVEFALGGVTHDAATSSMYMCPACVNAGMRATRFGGAADPLCIALLSEACSTSTECLLVTAYDSALWVLGCGGADRRVRTMVGALVRVGSLRCVVDSLGRVLFYNSGAAHDPLYVPRRTGECCHLGL
jgi:hypothetical protein